MSYTKGELVRAALNELGISDYEFDISPEELFSGMRRLDVMMSQFADRGLRLSYDTSGGVDDDSGVPMVALEGVITNLALRLASSYGKQVAPTLSAVARSSLSALYGVSASPREMQFPSGPKGAAYKSFDSPFTPEPKDEYLGIVNTDVDLSGGPDGT